MGLDQYATARKGEPRKVPQTWTTTDADGNEEEVVEYYNEWDDTIDLAEWRKHPNLQGFMEELWIQKGKPNANPPSEGGMNFGSDFNCVDLELTVKDIDTLEESLELSDGRRARRARRKRQALGAVARRKGGVDSCIGFDPLLGGVPRRKQLRGA